MNGHILPAVLGLAFVLGLIFLFAALMKRFGGPMLGGAVKGGRRSEIELLDMKAVDPKTRLVLVRCRDSDYLLVTGESTLVVASYPVAADNRTPTDGG